MMDKLQMAIEKQLDSFKRSDMDSDRDRKAVANTAELIKAYSSLQDSCARTVQIENNISEQRKERMLKYGLAFTGLAVTLWGAVKTFEFETTGSFGSFVGKHFMNELFHLKR